MKKISIIIVNYNSGNYLFRCLSSIQNTVRVPYEVIVVDNKSTDTSIDNCKNFFRLACFKLVLANCNLGFSRANNLGYKYSSGDLLHFLNPDTELSPDINEDYGRVYANLDIVYINRLQNLDKSFVQSKNLIPTLDNCIYKLFAPHKCQYWYTGATVIISRYNFEKIGKWNESFFMYSEDMDLFYNINKNKITVSWLKSVIIHVGGASSSKTWTSFECEIKKQESFKKFYTVNKIGWQYHIIMMLTIVYQLFKNRKMSARLINIWFKLL